MPYSPPNIQPASPSPPLSPAGTEVAHHLYNPADNEDRRVPQISPNTSLRSLDAPQPPHGETSSPLGPILGDFYSYAKSVSISQEEYKERQRSSRLLQAGVREDLFHRIYALDHDEDMATIRAKLTSGWIAKFLGFLTDHRTERAIRFILPIPICLYLSYSPEILGLTITQLVVIVYLLQAALLPPVFTSVSLIWFMAVPAVCFALGIITAVWCFDTKVAEGSWSDGTADIVTLLFLTACFLIVSNWKIGPLAPLLIIGFLVCVYVTEFVLISSTNVVRHGIGLTFPPIRQLGTDVEEAIRTLPKQLQVIIYPIWKMLELLVAIGAPPNLELSVPIPSNITDIDPSFQDLVGVPVTVRLSDTGPTLVSIPGGWPIVKFFWKGKGQTGIIYSAICCALIAVGFYIASLLMPPVRNMCQQLRNGLAAIATKMSTDLMEASQELKFVPIEKAPDTNDAIISPPPIPMVTKDSKFRLTHDINAEVLHKLETVVLTTAMERIVFSPVAINSLMATTPVLAELKAQNTHMLLFASVWTILHRVVADEGYTGAHMLRSIQWKDENGQPWSYSEWFPKCIELVSASLTAVGAALSTREVSNNETSKATLNLHCEERLRTLRAEIETRWVSAQKERVLALKDLLTALQSEADHWRIQFVFWMLTSLSSLLIQPLRLAHATEKYLKSQREQSLKGLGLSIGGFMAPLPILFAGLVSPIVDLVKYLRHKCGPAKFETPPQPGLWAKLSQSVFYHPKHSLRPRHSSLYPQADEIDELVYNKASSRVEGYSRRDIPEDLEQDAIRLSTRREYHNPFQHYHVWFIIRLLLGTIGFFALQLCWDDWRTLSFLHRPRVYAHISSEYANWDELISTRVGPWACLGFLVTLTPTVEGTVKRGIVRYCGVLLGTLSAWLALVAFPRSPWGQGVWMCVTDFIMVWVAANKSTPLLGFNTAWGYAGQIFTWQQAIIIVPAYLKQADRDELALSRLVAQLIGITAAMLVSAIIIPTRCQRAARLHLADALHCLKESLAALVELAVIGDMPPRRSVNLDGNKELLNEDELWEQWDAHIQNRMKAGTNHVSRASQLLMDNNYLANIPSLRTPPALTTLMGSISRLNSYRLVFKDYLTRAKSMEDKARVAKRIEDPAIMVNVEGARRALAEVCLELEQISLLLQTAMDHYDRWHWPWQTAYKGLSRDVLMHIFETCANQTTYKIHSLANQIVGLQHLLGPENAMMEDDKVVEEYVLLLLDRRAIMWSFLLVELEEYRWLAAHLFNIE